MSRMTWTARLGSDMVKVLYLLALSAVIAVGFNFCRENRLALVARENYENVIFQPCPETEQQAVKTELGQQTDGSGMKFPAGAVIVDCRSPEAFASGHIPGAVNVPYDELEGVLEADVARLRGSPAVVVYCDGWEDEQDPEFRYANPPSSLLADELKSRGISRASFLEGGLRAWLETGAVLSREGGAP